MGYTKVTINNWDIRPSVTGKALLANISWIVRVTDESLWSHMEFSRKSKRTKWGFLEVVAIINTENCPF